MQYTKQDNTYFATPKENPKDKIEVIVGDDKQEEFIPQLKIQRWDNEVNFSVRLKHNEETPSNSKVGEKVKWTGKKLSADIYALEEGHEFEVILKEKPLTNVIEFTIEDKGLDYFYQPELTQEEKENGASRPENVVGSYAVYASEQKTNYVGGKEYKCGKVGHIYRPRIEDSNGDWTWGELNIENKKLIVTIPQDFLDKAVYPVRHAAGLTFGYTTQGSSNEYSYANYVKGSLFTSPSGDNTAISLTVNLGSPISSTSNWKFIIVIHSSLNILIDAISPVVTSTDYGWYTGTFSTSPTLSASTEYVLGIIAASNGKYIKYDTGDANQGHSDSSNSYTTPANLGSASHTTNKYSIYATYTVAGDDYTLEAFVTSYTLTTVNTVLKKAFHLIGSVTSFTLTGINAIFSISIDMVASVTAYTLTTVNAILVLALNLITSVTSYTVTGINAILTGGKALATSVTSYAVTTKNALFEIGISLVASVTSFLLTVKNANITATEIEVTDSFLEKTYVYKIYDVDGNFITTWRDVVSDLKITYEINGALSPLLIRLARLETEYGEGQDIKQGNLIKIYCFDKESGTSGVCVYSGLLANYIPVVNGEEEYVDVTFFSHYWDLANKIIEDTGDTEVAYTTKDPSDILKDLLDKYSAITGTVLDYDTGTIEDTGTSVSYTFNTNSYQEGIKKVIELCPDFWYYRIEPDDKIYLKEREATPSHKLTIGKDIISYRPEKRYESIVNTIYFRGGDTGGGAYLYYKYTNSSSVTDYGIRAITIVDQRVTVASTAEIICNRILNEKSSPEIRVIVDVMDSNGDIGDLGYDIESIKVGETCQILNATQKNYNLWGETLWDVDAWDYDITNAAGQQLQIMSIVYQPDRATLTLSNKKPDITKRIEDIDRNFKENVTVDNPSTPS